MSEIPDTPPEDETARAIWTIRRLVKATTGQVISEADATKLFSTAQQRLQDAMSEVTPK